MYLKTLDSKSCCGCAACVDICPTDAVTMKSDSMGFKYPVIDKERCVSCHKCEQVCSFGIDDGIKDDCSHTAYGVINTDETVRAASRSGGVFTTVSDIVLNDGGSVFGCVLDENFDAVHIRAVTKPERNRFRGSKYIQSDISAIYSQIAEDLKSGKPVMFSGTACQIASVEKYLKEISVNADKLYLIDIVCHGVPSSIVWHDYIKYIEKKYRCRVEVVDFRNKEKFGWREHIETFKTTKGEIDSSAFRRLFYAHKILRDCCFVCPYKNTVRAGDLSLADFWGVEKEAPELDDNKGVSLVIIHTEKGRKLFESCRNRLKLKEVNIKNCLQPPLRKPFPMPDSRDAFWKRYKKSGIKWAIWNLYVERFRYIFSVLLEIIKKKGRKLL